MKKNFFTQKWYTKNLLCYLLTPFSAIYRLIIFVRLLLFRLGIKKITRFNVPIIIVGNITVGGTGKTPLIIWLANFLRLQGFQPGIVSRGYGGATKNYPQWVTTGSDPAIVGDEPVLLARNTDCPVVIAPKRVLAVAELLQNTPCNIILSDDGLQHYALARDIEIVVIDGQRRFGNGFCLPAGPLREPVKCIKKVDFVVCNGGNNNSNEFAMHLVAQPIKNLVDPAQNLLPNNLSRAVHAVAGIGNPQRFFSSLQQLGFNAIPHSYPDHYLFQKSDFSNFKKNDIIVMTEKDAVKCHAFADQRFWFLPVRANIDEKFSSLLLEKLKRWQAN